MATPPPSLTGIRGTPPQQWETIAPMMSAKPSSPIDFRSSTKWMRKKNAVRGRLSERSTPQDQDLAKNLKKRHPAWVTKQIGFFSAGQ